MNYKEAIDYLYREFPMFSQVGAKAYKPGLDNSLRLAEIFDNPHKKFKSIHVGGTNGKGSTSHMLASVLQTQGYKVGLYTSPHILDFRERMKVNGRMIPQEKVVDFLEKWRRKVSIRQESQICDIDKCQNPSFFEITMMMAFDWFAEEKVDYAVIEVGMGGRLDSTNIVTPIVSVITNISLDHTQFLGNTLEEIATEKAGIIKSKIPVVIGEWQKETEKIFLQKAQTTGSEITFADRYENKPDSLLNLASSLFRVTFQTSLFQEKNIKTVLSTLEVLRKYDVSISDQAIEEGIKNFEEKTGFFGRWMILKNQPLVIADGGHNPAGLMLVFARLRQLMLERPGGKLRIVIGFMADKDVDVIIDMMPQDATYYVTNACIQRALPASVLFDKIRSKGLKAKSCGSVAIAYEMAEKEASDKDIIFIGGSFSILSEFLRNTLFTFNTKG